MAHSNIGRCGRCDFSIKRKIEKWDKNEILFCEWYKKTCKSVAFNCKTGPDGRRKKAK